MAFSSMSTASWGSSLSTSLSDSSSSLSSLSSSEILDAKSSSFSFCPLVYLAFHKKATKQRKRDGFGNSPKMIQLYNFWARFLVDKFNDPMYRSFKRMAEEDAAFGALYGVDMLFCFYYMRMSKHFDAGLLSDFEQLANKFMDYMSHMEGMNLLLNLYSRGLVPPEYATWDPDTAAAMRKQMKSTTRTRSGIEICTCVKDRVNLEAEEEERDMDDGNPAIGMALLAAGARRRRRRGVTRVHNVYARDMLQLANSTDGKDMDKQQAKKDPSHNHWQHRPTQKLKHGREAQQLQLMQQLRTRLWTQNHQLPTEEETNSLGLPSRLGELLGD